ncbi:MAG: Ger(x)C family spore germination C-terminal domain-containing protein [Lachnospiraceae bacterium]|nr:Ger(x)C family spore germination C-terminal domain-containing protein [Lachnospiraceae bacterium]
MKNKIFLLIFPLLLSGCYDKTEMEERAFIINIGIDSFDQNSVYLNESLGGERFALSLDSAPLSHSGADKIADEETGVFCGTTFAEAIKAYDDLRSKSVFLGYAKAIVIAENVLKDPDLLSEAMDYIKSDGKINQKVILLAAKGKAYDIIKSIDDTESIYDLYISNFYRAKSAGNTSKTDLKTFLESISFAGNAVIPVIASDEGRVFLSGSAVLGDYKLSGYLSEDEEMGRLLLSGKADSKKINCGLNTLEVTKSSSRLSFKAEEGELILNADIKINGKVYGIVDKSDKNQIEETEKMFEEIIKDKIINTIEVTKNVLKTDGQNLMKLLYSENYNIYKSIADKRTAYENIKLNVSVSVNIK